MPQPPTRFIKPDVLSRIANLELLARSVVEGFIAGLHESPYKGVSVDFMEYRPYIPGDDLRHIDWKLYARTDRHYIKEYEDETNTQLHLLVDVSHSMGYRSTEGLTKLTYSLYMAAALAYLMIRQRDAVGITFFDEQIVSRLPARSTKNHLHTLLKHLENAELGKKTAIGKPLHTLARRQQKRGMIVLISDLLDEPPAIADGLKHFRFKGHEVIVFHVMDAREMTFDFDDLVELEDMETGEKMLVEPATAREIYLENLREYRAALEKQCGLLGVDYTLLTTDQPLDFALLEYLTARS